jgi:hypothetical protein
MRAKAWLLPVIAVLITACAGKTPMPAPPQPITTKDVIVPRPEEVCLKPDNHADIVIDFLKLQAHGTWRVKPGWVVSLRSVPMGVHIGFPRAVDPSSMKITVLPSNWQVAKWELGEAGETGFFFRVVPDGRSPGIEGQPGWVTLTVEKASGKDGMVFEGIPFSVKFFAYDQNLAESHPYLGDCHGTLAVQFDP